MTTNPYVPPTTDACGAPAPASPSVARRASLMLALTGFVLFYAVAMLLTAIRIDGEGTERAQAIACLTAFIAHLVGIGIAFAAPRGRRLAPALLNALSLASMVGLMAYAVTRAH